MNEELMLLNESIPYQLGRKYVIIAEIPCYHWVLSTSLLTEISGDVGFK